MKEKDKIDLLEQRITQLLAEKAHDKEEIKRLTQWVRVNRKHERIHTCLGCGETDPDEFYTYDNGTLKARCRECTNLASKQSRNKAKCADRSSPESTTCRHPDNDVMACSVECETRKHQKEEAYLQSIGVDMDEAEAGAVDEILAGIERKKRLMTAM